MIHIPIVLLASLMIGAIFPSIASAETGRIAWVIDGDTFRLDGGERIRIAGIDAAETDPANAKCLGEIAIGRKATRDAIALLKGRTVHFERIGRSYRRSVARVWLDGRDLGDGLVARGIAKPWPKGQPKPDWCG